MPVASKKTILLTCVISTVLSLLFADLGLQIGYYLIKGRFTWTAIEMFSVRDFTIRVNDERDITVKPNFKDLSYGTPPTTWSLETDKYGFRVGHNGVSESGENIVFIGDSIPFGWEVNSDETVPSRVYDGLVSCGSHLGVINAAIPSTSLDQAVHRFKYEIAGRFAIEEIVVQSYDPASQFAILGKEWDVRDNWTTLSTLYWGGSGGVLKYSALHFLYRRVFGGPLNERLDPQDYHTNRRYVSSIHRSLDTLLEAAGPGVRRVTLLSLAVPKEGWRNLSPQRQQAISLMNHALEQFASRSAERVRYINAGNILGGYSDNEVFRDLCCHLSPYGATIVAAAIRETC